MNPPQRTPETFLQEIEALLQRRNPEPETQCSPQEILEEALVEQSLLPLLFQINSCVQTETLTARVAEPLSLLKQVDTKVRDLLDVFVEDSGNILEGPQFTVSAFAGMRRMIAQMNLVPSVCLIPGDIWQSIIADMEFAELFNTVSDHNLILEGILGEILGVTVWTDGFRQDEAKFMRPGEAYMVAAPQYVGHCAPTPVILEGDQLKVLFGAEIKGNQACISKFKHV